MAHADVPELPCERAGWPGVSAWLLALSVAPPASGAALVAALFPLRAALVVQPLSQLQSTGMAAYFDAPGAPLHRRSFLQNGGLASALAAAAGLQDAVARSNATCAAAPLRLLRAGRPGAASLTREAATALLATAFLCLVPEAVEPTLFPEFCFRKVWSEQREKLSHAAKLDCYLHYFRSRAAAPPAPGVLRFERRVLDAVAKAACRNAAHMQLCPLVVEPHASICASHAPLRADFANKLLGGGALAYGCVQEEILFAQRPELCVGMLLCEKMRADEAIVMRGAACYSATDGFHDSFRWVGNVAAADAAAHDYVAFDARRFNSRWGPDPRDQWSEDRVLRELRKALVAFALRGGGPAPVVATGNWGCGAFGGNVHLKALLQWAAASLAQCPELRYHAFGAEDGLLAPALEAAVQHVMSVWPHHLRTAGGLIAAVNYYAANVPRRKPPLLEWLRSPDSAAAAALAA